MASFDSSKRLIDATRPAIQCDAINAGIDLETIPQHIAMIMDGNRRWAKRRGKIPVAGHRFGVSTVKSMIRTCCDLGIPYLTLYAFSTENWRRSPTEVQFLLKLFEDVLKRECRSLNEQGVRVSFIGQTDDFPQVLQDTITWIERETAHNTHMRLTIAANYGARSELTFAAKQLAADVLSGKVNLESIDEALFASYLSTVGLPDPDLVIRTSGEQRLSNYLLWQVAYSEIWVTPTCWPDFTPTDLLGALADFQQRQRRYGGG